MQLLRPDAEKPLGGGAQPQERDVRLLLREPVEPLPEVLQRERPRLDTIGPVASRKAFGGRGGPPNLHASLLNGALRGPPSPLTLPATTSSPLLRGRENATPPPRAALHFLESIINRELIIA